MHILCYWLMKIPVGIHDKFFISFLILQETSKYAESSSTLLFNGNFKCLCGGFVFSGRCGDIFLKSHVQNTVLLNKTPLVYL